MTSSGGGTFEIKIGLEDKAALLTVATQWIQEDTFDMRAEAENSAVFAFQSIHVPKLDRRPGYNPEPEAPAAEVSTTEVPWPKHP